MPDTESSPPFKPYRKTGPYIFVSYAHKDSVTVFAELDRLHKQGYRIWYDEGIDPGVKWQEEIARALDAAAFVLVFVSRNSVNSNIVLNEINFALNRGKKFLAVHLEETGLPAGLELRIGDLQAILRWRMTSENYEEKLKLSLPFELMARESDEKIYCSMSTIADVLPGLDFRGETKASDLYLHEDEWRQIEYFSTSRFAEIRLMAIKLALFEEDNRHGDFWERCFVRTLAEAPVVPGPNAVEMIASDLGLAVTPGPIIHGGRLTGRVAHGFTIRLAGGSVLYGDADSAGIWVLGARLGPDRDETSLMCTFRLLHQLYGLFMIDWRLNIFLTGISPEGEILVARTQRIASSDSPD